MKSYMIKTDDRLTYDRIKNGEQLELSLIAKDAIPISVLVKKADNSSSSIGDYENAIFNGEVG